MREFPKRHLVLLRSKTFLMAPFIHHVLILVLMAFVLVACGECEVSMSTGRSVNSQEFALKFTRALASREYDSAYTQTTQSYRQENSRAELQYAFEQIVPLDWGETEPIVVVETLKDWPDKQAADLIWIYLSIAGDVYSEGIAVVIAEEQGEPKIRQIEFGRP